jgi:hypothetical protein
MQELSNNDEMFQNPVSPKSSLKGVFADIMSDVKIGGNVDLSEEDVKHGAETKTLMRSNKDKDF